MKQIWITRKGPPEVLQLKEADDLKPRSHEVVISVKATGVNFSDILARRGRYPEAPQPPMVVGYEVSGTVEALGSEVKEFQIGQSVLAPVFFGGYSTQCVVPAEQVFSLPQGMSYAQGASFPIAYLTAYGIAVESARIKKGERVLIYSAAGGVGLALIDICRLKEAEIIAVAASGKHDFLKSLGVNLLVDSNSPGLDEELRKLAAHKRFDIIFDSRGGQSWASGIGLLAPFGKLIAFGFSSCMDELTTGTPAFIPEGNHFWYGADLFTLAQSNISVAGFNLATLWKRSFSDIRRWMEELLKYYADRKLHVHVDKEFAFEDAASAHRYLEERKNVGKVVLVTEN